MNYEQISLNPDSLTITTVDRFSFDDFPDSFIYAKLDCVKGVFNDACINDFFSWIGILDKIDVDDLITKKSEGSFCGSVPHFIFKFNGIVVIVPKIYMYTLNEDQSAFTHKLPSINFEMKGQGLDYLRSLGLPVDTMFRDRSFVPSNLHYTRIDFAFDFINYKQEIVSQLIDYAMHNHTDKDRIILCNGRNDGALGYKVITSTSGSTFYLGSRQSNFLLRVYDKNRESKDIDTGLYTKANPYGSPDSWIRFELQCNHEKANDFAFIEGDLTGILKEIHDKYRLADHNTPAHRREEIPFWRDFMDWSKLPPIIQNANLAPEREAPEILLHKAMKRAVRPSVLTLEKQGIVGFIKYWVDYLYYISTIDGVSPELKQRALQNFNSQCKSLGLNFNSTRHIVVHPKGYLTIKLTSQDWHEVELFLDSYDPSSNNNYWTSL